MTGMMGSGKSRVGEILAEKINYHFLDTDQYIEEQEKTSIQSIFENQGELYFRELEKQLLEDLNCNNTVIATGGGMVELEESDRLFSNKGVTVYLRCSVELLLKRVKQNQIERPNLKNESQFNSLLLKRIPMYEKADIIVDCDLLSAEHICDQIIDKLNL